MTNIFYPTAEEARLLTRQDGFTFLRLLKEQPQDDLNLVGEPPPVKVCEGYVWFGTQDYYECINLRYPSGEYDVKEPWKWSGWTVDGEACIEFKSGGYKWIDYSEDGYDKYEDIWISVCARLRKLSFPIGDDDMYHFTKENPNPLPWNSPLTMPNKAIRDRVKLKTTVKRVQDITDYEAMIMGNFSESEWGYNCLLWLEDHWNSLHAKPVRKGDGYVCYPYNHSSLLKLAYKSRGICLEEGGYSYKGKPLKEYPNAWLEVIEGRKV